MYDPRPIDISRAGRFVIACLDQNRGVAEQIVKDAVSEGTFPLLFDTLGGGLLGVLRLAIGDEKVRQWASDWVLHGSQSG